MTPEVSQCTRFQSKATSKYYILNIVNSTVKTRYVVFYACSIGCLSCVFICFLNDLKIIKNHVNGQIMYFTLIHLPIK